MTLFAEDVVEPNGTRLELGVLDAELRQALSMKPLILPVCEMPLRSPFMSAMKQGTPAWQNVSAITCSVTVFPVPVAPAMSP